MFLSWSVKNNEFLCANIVIISNNKVGVIHHWIGKHLMIISPNFSPRGKGTDTWLHLKKTKKNIKWTFHSDKTN